MPIAKLQPKPPPKVHVATRISKDIADKVKNLSVNAKATYAETVEYLLKLGLERYAAAK